MDTNQTGNDGGGATDPISLSSQQSSNNNNWLVGGSGSTNTAAAAGANSSTNANKKDDDRVSSALNSNGKRTSPLSPSTKNNNNNRRTRAKKTGDIDDENNNNQWGEQSPPPPPQPPQPQPQQPQPQPQHNNNNSTSTSSTLSTLSYSSPSSSPSSLPTSTSISSDNINTTVSVEDIEAMLKDYLANDELYGTTTETYFETPDSSTNPHIGHMLCYMMREAIHNLILIRKKIIKGEEDITRLWNEYRDKFAELFPLIGDGKYTDLINQGTGPNPNARGMTIQNYATLASLLLQSMTDHQRYNLCIAIDCCPRMLEQTFARYLAGEITNEKSPEINLGGILTMNDICPVAFEPDSKNRPSYYYSKMNEFSTDAHLTLSQTFLLNAINFWFAFELHYCIYDEPMLLLISTPYAIENVLDSSLKTLSISTSRVKSGVQIPHTQGWYTDFIKSNYSQDTKALFNESITQFYVPLLIQIGALDGIADDIVSTFVTSIANNWGKNETPEEIEAKQERRREMGRDSSDAWAAFNSGTATSAQDAFVQRSNGYKRRVAWETLNATDTVSPEQAAIIVTCSSTQWKLRKEKVIRKYGTGSYEAEVVASVETAAAMWVAEKKRKEEAEAAEKEKQRLAKIETELASLQKKEVRTELQKIRIKQLIAMKDGTRIEVIRWTQLYKAEKEKQRLVDARVKLDSLRLEKDPTLVQTAHIKMLDAIVNNDGNKSMVARLVRLWREEKKLSAAARYCPLLNESSIINFDNDFLELLQDLEGLEKDYIISLFGMSVIDPGLSIGDDSDLANHDPIAVSGGKAEKAKKKEEKKLAAVAAAEKAKKLAEKAKAEKAEKKELAVAAAEKAKKLAEKAKAEKAEKKELAVAAAKAEMEKKQKEKKLSAVANWVDPSIAAAVTIAGQPEQSPPGTDYTGITIAGQRVYRPQRCAQAMAKEEGSKQPPLQAGYSSASLMRVDPSIAAAVTIAGQPEQSPPGTHNTGITIAGQRVYRPQRCAQAMAKEEGSKQPPLQAGYSSASLMRVDPSIAAAVAAAAKKQRVGAVPIQHKKKEEKKVASDPQQHVEGGNLDKKRAATKNTAAGVVAPASHGVWAGYSSASLMRVDPSIAAAVAAAAKKQRVTAPMVPLQQPQQNEENV